MGIALQLHPSEQKTNLSILDIWFEAMVLLVAVFVVVGIGLFVAMLVDEVDMVLIFEWGILLVVVLLFWAEEEYELGMVVVLFEFDEH